MLFSIACATYFRLAGKSISQWIIIPYEQATKTVVTWVEWTKWPSINSCDEQTHSWLPQHLQYLSFPCTDHLHFILPSATLPGYSMSDICTPFSSLPLEQLLQNGFCKATTMPPHVFLQRKMQRKTDTSNGTQPVFVTTLDGSIGIGKVMWGGSHLLMQRASLQQPLATLRNSKEHLFLDYPW